MKWKRWLVKSLIALWLGAGVFLIVNCRDAAQELAQLEQARPAFTDADALSAAIAMTYEAQVFPEPDRSRAYRAIAWTMRNRVTSGYDGTTGYADEDHLLYKYAGYRNHRIDIPDAHALAIARQVLGALTNEDDLTHGARHYVDNSYWTGTHEQTGLLTKPPYIYCDSDIQQMVDAGRFVLTVEWKAPPGHPRGALFYGLYFFDYWPPPDPFDLPLAIPIDLYPSHDVPGVVRQCY